MYQNYCLITQHVLFLTLLGTGTFCNMFFRFLLLLLFTIQNKVFPRMPHKQIEKKTLLVNHKKKNTSI